MSVGYRAIQWNRDKLVYDGVLITGIVLFIGIFMAAWSWINPPASLAEWSILRVRAFGICAFTMLTLVLMIGPLARLDRRFLPVLYNRRHFGVATFVVASVHAILVVLHYRAQDLLDFMASQLVNFSAYTSIATFPFHALGIASLAVLFLMASTSHDYWLNFLTPRTWKSLHMALYAAYGLLVLHVALGIMQEYRSPIIPLLLGAAFLSVTTLHVVAGWRERPADHGVAPQNDGWIAVGPPRSIPDKRARIVAVPGGERIAVFRDGDRIGALTNLCAHQNGPLGEGRIIDGCITCPWHGYQYKLDDGCAPAPFTERLVTYRVRLRGGVIEVDPRPLAPGTPAAISLPPGTT
ncbi:MAG: ferric reductase-like transmembrane domain-containing protein [Rhizobiales bacterium]|nr:ferric reductase-like transmembrane domain-containing protein [Hyphomicrobiales bacterium]